MKKIVKSGFCILLSVLMVLSFASCSKNNDLTEENVTKTVEIVNTALKEFDTDTLRKYVSSDTLSTILTFADEHEQFIKLGQAIFSNLELEVQDVDLENKTVTVKATNKSLVIPAMKFAQELKSNYSTIQLLGKLSDDSFLDSSLAELQSSIKNSTATNEAVITLTVEQGKKNLVLGFDSDAEDAVSGGAVKTIKSIFGLD